MDTPDRHDRSEVPAHTQSGPPYRLAGSASPASHADCYRPIHISHSDGTQEHWLRIPRRGCYSFDCPADVNEGRKRWANKWAMRESGRIAARLGKSVRHVVDSPPKGTRADTPEALRRLRARAYEMVRRAFPNSDIVGAVVVHPKRGVGCDRGSGHDGIHFHFALRLRGLRRYDGRAVARLHAETGWIVKVLGIRDTRALMLYELHHAGRWLSCLEANSAHTPYATEAVTLLGRPPKAAESALEGLPRPARKCPVCGWDIPADDWHVVEWWKGVPVPATAYGISDRYDLVPAPTRWGF